MPTFTDLHNSNPATALTGAEFFGADQGGQTVGVTGVQIVALVTAPISGPAGASLVGFSQAGTGSVARTSQAKLRENVSVRDFGAVGNGIADDTAALNAAITAATGFPAALSVTAGTYNVTSNLTFTSFTTFQKGAILLIQAGVTITFSGGISADPFQIFNCLGSGVVVFSSNMPRIGYAEWWGAKTNVPALDNSPFIQACLNACQTTILLAGQYYIGTGAVGVGTYLLKISGNGKRLIGSGASKTFTLTGVTSLVSELVINSASASGILLGYATSPGAVATWAEGIELRGFTVRRNIATYPLGNPATGNINSPCGIVMKWAAVCKIIDVYTFEHTIGCFISGTVACRLTNVRHERYSAGTSISNDFFVGNYMDNSAASGFNSGNASLYFIGGGAFSNEAAGYSYTYNSGITSYQGFTDTYVDGFETANTGYGVDFNGVSTSALDFQTEDLLITNSVFDGCRWDAIRIQTCGPRTAVQITENYVAVSNATGPVSNAIHIIQVHGSVNIANNQGLASVGNPAQGLFIDASSGVVARGNIWTDLSSPVVLNGAVLCRVEDHINVAAVGPAVAAVSVTNSQYAVIDCDIANSSGVANIPIAVDLIGALNSHIEIRCTNIYTPSLVSSSANKLVANGTQIIATGAFNAGAGLNCLAAGIMS